MFKTFQKQLLQFCRVRTLLFENHQNFYGFGQSFSNTHSWNICNKAKTSSVLSEINMHQSKISSFFKKSASTSSPTQSPLKKPEPKEKPPKISDDEEEEVEKRKDKKSPKPVDTKKVSKEDKKEELKSGRKRKSKVSSEEEDDPKETKTKSKSEKSKDKEASGKRKGSESNGNKKPRRRIVIQDSSSESEAEKKMEVEEDQEPPAPIEVKKANGNSKKKDRKNKSSDSESEEEEKKKVEVKPVKTSQRGKNAKSESPKETSKIVKPEPKKNGRGKKSTSPKAEAKSRGSKKTKAEVKEAKSDDEKSETNEDTEKSKVEEDEEEDDDSKTKKDVKVETKNDEEKPNGKSTMRTLGGGATSKGWNADYNPAKSHYHPIDDASWNHGEKVPYLALAKTLEVIEATSSRLKFIEILANYFRSVIVLTPGDLLFSVYLCLNKLAPAYEGIELGVAETNIMKAIAQATGRSLDKIKIDAGTLGDLGLVAETSRSSQKTLFQPQPLTVSGVFYKLKEIASMHGNASQAKKISMITSMLVACKYSEARYLTRSLAGKLRIGLAEQSLLQALAQATYLTPPNQDVSVWPPKILNAGKKMSPDGLKSRIEDHAYIVKSSFCDCPNYDILVKALLEVGIDGIAERCKLTPGIPPRPMLAQPTKGVSDVLERFEGIRFTCEYKYDGERAQIHLCDDGTLNIYSRNQENNTSKYPDIISRFDSCIKTKGTVTSCILDSEAVAWDLDNKTILPFQVLSTRKRKDANEAEIKVQVCIFAFDLIYLNGKSLIKEPLIKRRELLREHFQEVTGEFVFATSLDTDSMEEVQEFLEESIKGNCEGLMVKTLDERATYELAKRSQKWLKLKKDYMDCGGDSLDLVVIGGFYGKGKRAGNYGGFLLACYDPDEEVYQTICKLGTGFSDEQLQSHSEFLKPHVITSPKSYYRFNSQLTPDQWFDAVQVWEVKCADLSLSPVHTAAEGIADTQRGVSLRFPRFLRIRDDKNIEDATSSRQVADMYKNQEQVKNTSGKNGKIDDDDEFY